MKIFATLILVMQLSALAAVQVWTAPAAVKITEDATPPAKADAKAPAAIVLAGARREYVAAQIALRSDSSVIGIDLDVSSLEGPGEIYHDRITLFREDFVNTNLGRRPDPLAPLRSFNLKPNKTQPIYLEAQITPETAPGDYKGEVVAARGNLILARIPITLRVYDFEVPLTPSLRTAFGNSERFIPAIEKIPPKSAVYERYRKEYYDILLAHRLSPFSIPAPLMTVSAEPFLNDARMTSFLIPYLENDDEGLRTLVSRLKTGGWLKKGYFYVVDEPNTFEAFQRLATVRERLNVIEPDLKLIAPFNSQPKFQTSKTVWDYLEGKVNIWCFLTSMYDEAKVNERRAAGEEIWDYIAWQPAPPYANFLITNDAMDHRMLFWQEYKFKVQGLLYWSTNFWTNNKDGTTDPWEDMATVKFINKDIYGDGSLLYPGRKIAADGPQPSLRLKLIRQGMQDYEYIKMAAAKNKEAADAIVNEHVKSWTEFEKDPAAIETAKAKLAELIKPKAK